jgi:hypothetical protein
MFHVQQIFGCIQWQTDVNNSEADCNPMSLTETYQLLEKYYTNKIPCYNRKAKFWENRDENDIRLRNF